MGVSGIRRGKSKLSTRNPSVFQHPSTRSEHFLKSLHPFPFFIDQARYLTEIMAQPPMPHGPFPGPRAFPWFSPGSCGQYIFTEKGAAPRGRGAKADGPAFGHTEGEAAKLRQALAALQEYVPWQRSEGVPRGFDEQMIKHDQTPGIFDRNLMSKL